MYVNGQEKCQYMKFDISVMIAGLYFVVTPEVLETGTRLYRAPILFVISQLRNSLLVKLVSG
jgi:hypothetical protein